MAREALAEADVLVVDGLEYRFFGRPQVLRVTFHLAEDASRVFTCDLNAEGAVEEE